MTIDIKDMTLTLDLKNVKIGDLFIVLSTVGYKDLYSLKTMINDAFWWGLPFVNEELKKFPLYVPRNILGLFELSDLNLAYFDHFIQMGLTPTFIPLPARPAPEVVYNKYYNVLNFL